MATAIDNPSIRILESIADAVSTTASFAEDREGEGVTRDSLLTDIAVSMNMQEASLDEIIDKNIQASAATEDMEQSAGNKAEQDAADHAKNRGVFKAMAENFKSGLANLKDGLKQDFDLLTLGFSDMASQPGIRSIISILSFIGVTLGKMLFEMVAGKFFSGLMKTGTDGQVMVKDTMKAIGGWAKGLLGFGPKIDRKTGEEVEDDGEGGKIAQFKANMKAQYDSMTEGLKTTISGFAEGVSNRFNTLKEKTATFFKPVTDTMSKAYAGMAKSWGNFKEKTAKKMGELKDGALSWFQKAGGNIKAFALKMFKTSMEFIKNTAVFKWLSRASKAMMTSVSTMAATFMGHVKRMLAPIGAFITASMAFLASMIMAAAAMIAPALPWIAIGIIIALIVVGLIFLGKYLMDNWETIKEKFSIAMEQLSIWVDKAALWLGGMLSPMRDGVARFFGAIMDGIANMVNGAIGYINSMKPDWIPGGDLIDWRMDADNMAKAEEGIKARATERVQEGEDIKAREGALADRRAALDSGKGDSGDASVVATTVNNNNQRKTIQVLETEPSDRYTGMMAIAQ
jgi:hypothetical protein